MSYGVDKKFTDTVHTLAVKKIYSQLGWKQISPNEEIKDWIDKNIGFDYVFKDSFNNTIFVQERFREEKYKNYNDFTIRFKRDYSTVKDRIKSEFFKIKADFFVYGVVNKSKKEVLAGKDFDFLKFIVINLKTFFCLVDFGYVDIGNISEYEKNEKKLICQIKQNVDYSSSFIVIDINNLLALIQDLNIEREKIVLIQKNFY